MIYTLYPTEITVDRPIESSVDQTVKSNMDTTNKRWIQPLSDPAPQGDDTSDTAAAAVSDTQPNVSKEHFRGKLLPLLPPVPKFNQDGSSRPSISATVETAQGQVPNGQSMLVRSIVTTHNKGTFG